MWKESHESNLLTNPVHSFSGMVLFSKKITFWTHFRSPYKACLFPMTQTFSATKNAHIFFHHNPFYYGPAILSFVYCNKRRKKWRMQKNMHFDSVQHSWRVDAVHWSKGQIVYNSIVMHLLYSVIKILAICAILKYDPCKEFPLHLMYEHQCKYKCSQAKYTNKFTPTRWKFISFYFIWTCIISLCKKFKIK